MKDVRISMSRFMDNEIFLSVIVPVYNVERYLDRCYQSINIQKIKNIELIFINDNSTDGSLELLKNLSKDDERVIIINKTENDIQGAGSSRNIGIEASRGKYLYFMDADDYLAEDAFEVLKNNIESKQCQVMLFGFTAVLDNTFSKIYESDRVQDECFSPSTMNERLSIISKIYFANSSYAVWNKVYLRDFLVKENIKFPNTRTAQDAFFNIEVFKKVETFCWVSDRLYFYIVNRENSNQNAIKSKFLDEYELLQQLELLTSNDSKSSNVNLFINSERLRIVNNEIKFLYRQNPKLVKKAFSNNKKLYSVIQEIDFKIFLKNTIQIRNVLNYILLRSKLGLTLYTQLLRLKNLGI